MITFYINNNYSNIKPIKIRRFTQVIMGSNHPISMSQGWAGQNEQHITHEGSLERQTKMLTKLVNL